MNDNQRTAVLAAIAVADTGDGCSAGEVSQQALRRFGLTRVKRIYGSGRMAVSRSRIELPEHPTTMTVLHAVAHVVTDSVFPPHGAEFCAHLLELTKEMAPYSRVVLQQEFDHRRIIYTADQRRKAALKAAAQRSGDGTVIVQAVLDDPPDCVVGPMVLRVDSGVIVIGDDELDIRRLRYLAKVS